jgi:hypothetical protein
MRRGLQGPIRRGDRTGWELNAVGVRCHVRQRHRGHRDRGCAAPG